MRVTRFKSPIVLFACLLLSACASGNWHDVYPYPKYIESGVQEGKEVKITTDDGNEHVFVAETAEDGRVKGKIKDQPIQIPYDDIVAIQINSEEAPDWPCGGAVPLGCSIPEVLTMWVSVVEEYQREFHDACVFHDFCYRHGYITYGMNREQCDADFLENMKRICDVKLVSWEFVTDPLNEGKCLVAAANLYQGVRRYGEEYFRIDNSTYCEYQFPESDDMDTSGLVGLIFMAE